MKYILIVGDGMADRKIAELNNKTPLEYLNLPGMARVVGGRLGRFLSCPEGLPPGSDVAFLSLLGNDAKKCYTGRSPLEAAGLNAQVNEGDVCFRVNLVTITDGKMASHNGFNVVDETALSAMRALMADEKFASLARGLRFTPTPTFRHVAAGKSWRDEYRLTPPHDIAGREIEKYLPEDETLRALTLRSMEVLAGRQANCAWFWGAGTAARLENFEELFRLRGCVVSAVPLVKGIARLMGMTALDYPFATGLLETGYQDKARAALAMLEDGYDFALVHVEAPDEASHEGSLRDKLEAMRRIDSMVVEPILASPMEKRVMVMPDHYTLISTRTHDGTPVPYAISGAGEARPFTERACEELPVITNAPSLLGELFKA